MGNRPPLFFRVGLTVILVGFILGGLGIFTAGLYDRLTLVSPDCNGGYQGQTPASFAAPIDSTPYLMPDYQEVHFPSRDGNITIAAWWVPGPTADAPAVVLAHGSHECKRSSSVLFPAGMLHRHGYAVLLIDLRNEGSSTVTNGRFAGGVGEARDVLGAWDWLRREKGLPASRIGLFGVSLGAAAVVTALGYEPGVAAVWEDSGYADIVETFRWRLALFLVPFYFSDITFEISRLKGEEIASPSPGDSLRALNGRPLAIVHGVLDLAVPLEQALELESAARAAGGQPEVWILPGVGHVGAMGSQPAEYERRMVAFFDGALRR
ncbi:MAG: prolyl oligopeptidase family serine peptidase [Candidatus Limnocylindrales bacterium]